MRAMACLQKVIREFTFDTAVDIGGGKGDHWKYLKIAARNFVGIDALRPSGFKSRDGEWIEAHFPNFDPYLLPDSVDLVWCSHCLEHQLNPHEFLRSIYHLLDDGGVLAITVPPRKDQIVGGHVSIWNAGLLLYHLILAGFDCSSASVMTDDYNVSVIVKKKPIEAFPELEFARGDIEKLSAYFPFEAKHGFDGNISAINW